MLLSTASRILGHWNSCFTIVDEVKITLAAKAKKEKKENRVSNVIKVPEKLWHIWHFI